MKSFAAGLDIYEQIDELESRFETEEPKIMAFLPEKARFKRLRADAAALLLQTSHTGLRPPLFGEFLGVKDIFHVDGFETHAGSSLPADVLHGREAESVSKLKAAGSLIVGKTVTTEFAYFSPGPTRNPHNLEHTPGGSSSGSAAAIAGGLSTMTLGTQTIGSIVRPASFCGVVGFKPSYGQISRSGVIPLAPSLDHVGFFTETVSRARRVAAFLLSHEEDDSLPRNKPILGIPDGSYLMKASEEGLAHFVAVCKLLTQAGYEIKHVQVMHDFEEIRARNNSILASEAATVHAAWFEKYSERYTPRTAELILSGQRISKDELDHARMGQKQLRADLKNAMDANHIDLWITPSTPGPAPKGLDSTGDPVMNLPWTQAGMPALNLPSGESPSGLPMGLQLISRFGMDKALLVWGEDIEPIVSPR